MCDHGKCRFRSCQAAHTGEGNLCVCESSLACARLKCISLTWRRCPPQIVAWVLVPWICSFWVHLIHLTVLEPLPELFAFGSRRPLPSLNRYPVLLLLPGFCLSVMTPTSHSESPPITATSQGMALSASRCGDRTLGFFDQQVHTLTLFDLRNFQHSWVIFKTVPVARRKTRLLQLCTASKVTARFPSPKSAKYCPVLSVPNRDS